MKLLLPLFMLSQAVSAQWRLGAYVGADYCFRSIDAGYWTDFDRKLRMGVSAAASAQYNFNKWFGVRTDLALQQRNYCDRLYKQGARYTTHNTYCTLPLMLNFSVGKNKTRWFANVGAYAGYLTSKTYEASTYNILYSENRMRVNAKNRKAFDCNRDKRFDAGFVFGAGVNYALPKNVILGVESLVYYGLTNTHKTGSSYYFQPSYDTVLSLVFSVSYLFNGKSDK